MKRGDLEIGYCLEPHDLAASKLAAGREKDRSFVQEMLRHAIVDAAILKDRLAMLPVAENRIAQLQASVRAGTVNQPKPGPDGSGA